MTNGLDERTYDLLFGIQRSVHYHLYRRRFYESWNTLTVTISVIGGSASAVTYLTGWIVDWIPAMAAATVAIVATIDLTVGTGRRAGLHGGLARQFINLEKSLAGGRDLDDDEYIKLNRMRLDIESTEPPVLRLLDASCHFELLRSKGDTSRHPQIPLWRRLLIQWASQPTFAVNLAQN